MQRNPFKPTAGKTPPIIIGRESVLEEFAEGLENGPGAPGRLMRISGVRGTGKTVLLGEIERIAKSQGWVVVDEVATEGLCQRIVGALVSKSRIKQAKLEPSLMGVSLGSLDIERIGPTLREAMAAAIERNGHGLLITLDEVQDAVIDEVRTLSIAIQQLIGDDLDIAFVFAGLPSMVEGVINGKTLTFLRRALPFELKAVDIADVEVSFEETMGETGMSLDGTTAGVLANASHGYPFMIQLVGYYAWQQAKRAKQDKVGPAEAQRGIKVARERFDATVIEPALQRVSPLGIEYLLTMAEDGQVSSSSAIAKRLGKTLAQLSTTRAKLLADSLIEAPGYGKVAFAIPYMAEYLNVHREELRAALLD